MSDDLPPEPGLDPNLERRLDAVARQQMAEAEAQAAELAARSRTLGDVVWAAVQGGHAITVRSGTHEQQGLAAYARGDLVSLHSRFGTLEVNLAAIDALLISPEAVGPGKSVPREAESFAARLALIALQRERVELTTRGIGRRIEGSLTAVAIDHVVVETAQSEVFVPLAVIAWVLRRALGDVK